MPSKSTTEALELFHKNVLSVLEKLVPKRKPPAGKRNMSKARKTIWSRLSKVNERLMKSTSAKVIADLMKEKMLLEAKLKQSYQSANQKTENAVISKIKLNPKAFFSFAKTKQKTRAKIGPFLDKKNKEDKPRPSKYCGGPQAAV